MKNYLLTLKRLVTDFSVYRQLLTQVSRLSLKHFLTSYIIFSAIITLYLTQYVIPPIIEQSLNYAQALAEHFPPNHTVHITPESLSISGTDSLIRIPLDPTTNNGFNRLLIIDPPLYAEAIRNTNSIFYLTGEAMAFRTDINSDSIRVITWKELGLNFDITQESIIQEVDNFQHSINTIKQYSYPITFIFVLFGLTGLRLLSVLIYSFIFASIGNLITRPYPFRSYFNLGIYATIMAETVNLLHFAIYQSSFSSLFPWTFIGIMVIIIYSLPRAFRVKKS